MKLLRQGNKIPFVLKYSLFFFFFSRVSQFVYVPTKDTLFSTLDQHADTLEGDVKPPLVLIGNEGKNYCANN
jgi:hypothetical protein